MATKQCIVSPCTAPRLPGTSRCAAHRHWHQRVRAGVADRSYEKHWRRLRQQLLTDWVERYGFTCAGLGRAPHFARELTVYHPSGIVRRGAEPPPAGTPNAKAVCRDCRIGVRGRP